MAYGNQVQHWRSYGNWSTSTSGKNFTVTLTVGIGSVAWGYNINSGIRATANIDGTTKSVSGGFHAGTGATVNTNMVSLSKTFTRGHSNANKSLSWSATNSSGYHNGTSSGSGTVTVPALASHTVTFNANGGSGGPGSTTKWEYENLTIPSSVPTRTNYKFLGWSSSSSSNTVEYQAGKTYDGTKDANYTLYAVWELLYVPPSFSNALALRTASSSSTTSNPSGAYCYASFTWKVDTTVYTSNVLKSISVKYYQDGSTSGIAVTPSGTTSGSSGTINVHFAAALASVYEVVCTVTDSQAGSVSIARSIGSGSIPIEVANNGQSIGIGSAAPTSAGVKIGSSGTPTFTHMAETINGNLNSMAQIYGSTSSTAQGELTLSTQGLNSSGAVDRGTINLIANQVKLNGADLKYSLNNNWYVFHTMSGLTVCMHVLSGTATNFTNTGTSTTLYKNLGWDTFPITFKQIPMVFTSLLEGSVLTTDSANTEKNRTAIRIMFNGTSAWLGSSVPYKIAVMAIGLT